MSLCLRCDEEHITENQGGRVSVCNHVSVRTISVCNHVSVTVFLGYTHFSFHENREHYTMCVSPLLTLTLCVRVSLCLVILWRVPCFQAELSLGSIRTQYLFDSRLNDKF